MNFSPTIIQKIIDMYEQDANSTYTSIGKIFQASRKVVARILKKNGVKPKTPIKNERKLFIKEPSPKPIVKQKVQCSMSAYCYENCTHQKPHFPFAMITEDRICTKEIFCEVIEKKCKCQYIKQKNICH